MGKKKRYIMRAAKFGKKMFNFLDKLDGTQDSNLTDSRIDTSISKISITDRGNRTYAIQVEGRGPGDTNAKANLEQDTVKLTVDGTAVHAANFLVFAEPPAGSAGDRDRFKTTMVAPAPADGAETAAVKLSAAEHTIIAQIMKENKTDVLSKEKTKKFVLAEPKVDLSMFSAEEDAVDAGKIRVKWAGTNPDVAAANTAGVAGEASGRLPGEEDFTLGNSDGSTKNDLAIVVKDKDGAAVAIADPGGAEGGDYDVVGGTGGTVIHTLLPASAIGNDLETGILIQGAGALANGPYSVTITPRDKAAAEHTPSAVTITGITIA